MAFEDDKLQKTIFPTREGPPQGAGTERKMLEPVGGAETIRTQIKDNPDGSTTMLRTRAGNPEFTTRGGIQDGVCIKGPIVEQDYSEREWYPDAVTPQDIAKFHKKSTDGIWTLRLRPLKKLKAIVGKSREMEFWFSRDNGVTPPVAPATPQEKNKTVWEVLPRTFHQPVPAYESAQTGVGLHFAIDRIKNLYLKFPTKQTIYHAFSNLFSTVPAPKIHGCTNQNSAEDTMKNRTFFGADKAYKVQLREMKKPANKLVEYEFKTPGWFLDYLGGPFTGDINYNSPVADRIAVRQELKEIMPGTNRPDATNLSKVNMFGAMWHGLASSTGIDMPIPLQASTLTHYAPDNYVPPDTGDCYLVKSPANLPVPIMPSNFDSLGAEFRNYALIFGSTGRYSVTGLTFSLGSGRFIHFDTNNNASVLWARVTAHTSTSVTVKISDLGPIENLTAPVLPGQVVLFEDEIFLPVSPSAVNQAWATATVGVDMYWPIDWFVELRINPSPDGRKVLAEVVCEQHNYSTSPVGWDLNPFKNQTHHVIEFSIPADKVTPISWSVIWSMTETLTSRDEPPASAVFPYPTSNLMFGYTSVSIGAPWRALGAQTYSPSTGYTNQLFTDKYEFEITYYGGKYTLVEKRLAHAGYDRSGNAILTEAKSTNMVDNGRYIERYHMVTTQSYPIASIYPIAIPAPPTLMAAASTNSLDPYDNLQPTDVYIPNITTISSTTQQKRFDIEVRHNTDPPAFSASATYPGPHHMMFSAGPAFYETYIPDYRSIGEVLGTKTATYYNDPPADDMFTSGLGYFPERMTNSVSRIATLRGYRYYGDTNEKLSVAVVSPKSHIAWTSPGAVYASYSPNTEDLSVGTTPRCFV